MGIPTAANAPSSLSVFVEGSVMKLAPVYSAVYATERPKGVASPKADRTVSFSLIGSKNGKRLTVFVTPATIF